MRERLIQLICNLDVYNCEECQKCPSFKYDLHCDDVCFATKVADYLISNVALVVHGRWVNVQNGKGCCSECNRLDAIDPIATHCRYCGARMDGE